MNEKLVKELRRLNYKSPYKIRYRKAKVGYSLYLDFQRRNSRIRINLKGLVIKDLNSTLVEDRKMIKKAAEKQIEYNQLFEMKGSASFKRIKLNQSNVVDFYESCLSNKQGNTLKNWTNAFKHFKKFTKSIVKFEDIDLDFCEQYREYLLSQTSENTTCTYFSNFKTVLNNAIKKGFIEFNIASYIKNPKPKPPREYLSIKEVKILYNSNYPYFDLKNAFLFSCFTGLRISDIKKLKWSEIDEGYIKISQLKTDEFLRVKLSDTANEIINDQRKKPNNSTKVFDLPGEVAINKHLKKWVKENGIKKHITFHCARHTFATMCLTSDIDIYTVSKLLGHTDIKNTQIYAKLIDKKKDEAIDKLPSF